MSSWESVDDSTASISGRIVRGMGALGLSQVIGVLSRVLITPLFLWAWGAEIYGSWQILASLTSFMAFTDLGSQLYVVNRMTQAHSVGDRTSMRKVLHSGILLNAGVYGVSFVSLVLFAITIQPERSLGIAGVDRWTVFALLVIFAGQFMLGFIQGFLLGIYRAVGQLPRSVMIGNFAAALQLILLGGALALRASLVTVALLQLMPFMLTIGVAVVELRRHHPYLGLGLWKDADLKTMRSLVKPSLGFLAVQVSQMIVNNAPILIVGAVEGSKAVAIFTALRVLASSMRQLQLLICNSAWPELTRLESAGQYARLVKVFRLLLRSSLSVGCVLVVTLHHWGNLVFDLWLRGGLAYDRACMNALLLYSFGVVAWMACGILLMAVSRHGRFSQVALLTALLEAGLGYAGIRFGGLAGLVVGMVIADVMVADWAVPLLLVQGTFGISWGWFFTELAIPTAAIAASWPTPFLAPVSIGWMIWWWWQAVPQSEWRRLFSKATGSF